MTRVLIERRTKVGVTVQLVDRGPDDDPMRGAYAASGSTVFILIPEGAVA